MGILKLKDALKTIIIDYGDDILDDPRKTKAFLSDYTGDESREEIKILTSIFENNLHHTILKQKTFDDLEQDRFIKNITASSFTSNEKSANHVLEMLFTVFYDCSLISRKIIKNKGNIIDFKIEFWKKKLLDLGKRNRLINYRDTKRSCLRFVTPGHDELWSKVVVKGRPLEFSYIDEFDDEDTNQNVKLKTSGIVTNQSPFDQQKTLRNLKTRAKSINEEQGINVLHMAFGFLNWKENNDTISSPLILVPVNITQKSISSPFLISIDGDDVIVNPTLSHKMEHDFGIILPEFDIDTEINLFFSGISAKIKNIPGWSCTNDTVLGLFSFLKINMYDDLTRNSTIIKKHPIIKALTGDASKLADSSSINPKNYDHDKIDPKYSFQILDADSSQQDAIISAKHNLSFVLQGPPGTGKSQTIANIIAECLAAGRKVLFVSEKVAALDVVHRRLSNAGLSDFCLTLHSHKSNKKEIINEIGKNLNAGNIKPRNNDDNFTFTKLFNDIKTLNEYSGDLHKKILGLQKSIYEVYGELAKLDKYQNINFNHPSIESLTTDDLNNFLLIINAYSLTFNNFSNDFALSPWNGTILTDISYDQKTEFNQKVKELLEKLIDFEPLHNEIKNLFFLKLNDFHVIIEILRTCSNAAAIYPEWLDNDFIKNLKKNYSKGESLCQNVNNKLIEIQNYLSENEDLHFDYDPENVKKIKNLSDFNLMLDSFKSYVRQDDYFSVWEKLEDFSAVRELFTEIKEKINSYNLIKNAILQEYEDSVLDINAKAMLKRFIMEYSSIFKLFKKQYSLDRKELINYHRNITKKVMKHKDAVFINDLQNIQNLHETENWFIKNKDAINKYFTIYSNGLNTDLSFLQKKVDEFEKIIIFTKELSGAHSLFKSIHKSEDSMKNCFMHYYNGIDTNWEDIKNAVSWAEELSALRIKYNLEESFIQKACNDNNLSSSADGYLTKYEEKYTDIKPLLNWYYGLFENEIFNDKDITFIINKVNGCNDNYEGLEHYILNKHEKDKCIKSGLTEFILQIELKKIRKENITKIFKKHFYTLWLGKALMEFDSIKSFRKITHENIIKEYNKLDIKQLSVSVARIKEKLINKIPSQSMVSKGDNESKILKHEINKKRRIMPLRKLFQKIPSLLLTLKPCLMMSPLTVSLFLESDEYHFDTVIFDEASQVCTENAIGAIIRGKQVILAGDSKQLPPTTFFTASISDNEYDEEEQDDYTEIDSYESILDEAESSLFPSHTLKWHYRSKHEDLITFSNSLIYQNKLITFPSNRERSPDNGVEYIYIEDGIYDRGGKRDNKTEALAVVDQVFKNIEKYPDRSMGIITFSVAQRETIEFLLRKKRRSDKRFEEYFSEEKEEAFFIKNIETVQGDERDTIIFSIGYAKDIAGKMSMFFGPLSALGGERRLNVAVTRAKYNIKLIGSILPSDIKIDRITSEGPKLLRQYIDFAMNGSNALYNKLPGSDNTDNDPPFEESICGFLITNGYEVSKQIGCSGYRIDMAVRNPNNKSSYCLGIVCDGFFYNSARTARERDRLRQTVLEDMGWKIYRIWSTEWIKNTKAEKEKLLAAVESAVRSAKRKQNI